MAFSAFLKRLAAEVSDPGRRTVIVPLVSVSRRGLPWPLRYPGVASTASRRADFARPNNTVTPSSNKAWMKCWVCWRANSSNRSHVLAVGFGFDTADLQETKTLLEKLS